MSLKALPHFEHDAGPDRGTLQTQAQPADQAVHLDMLDEDPFQKFRHRRRDLDEERKEQLFLFPEMSDRLFWFSWC